MLLLQGESDKRPELVYCPQWVREEFTSLAQLFGSLRDERESTQEAGARRLQEMDVEEAGEEEHQLLFLDGPGQILPFIGQ